MVLFAKAASFALFHARKMDYGYPHILMIKVIALLNWSKITVRVVLIVHLFVPKQQLQFTDNLSRQRKLLQKSEFILNEKQIKGL